jgi:hypothetical protein
MMAAVPPRVPLYRCSNASGLHEIEQSQVTKARYITLSPIHVSKDKQRQSPPRPFMMFQIWRECPADGIERSAHGFQGFGILPLYLRPCKPLGSATAGGTKSELSHVQFTKFVKIVSPAPP